MSTLILHTNGNESLIITITIIIIIKIITIIIIIIIIILVTMIKRIFVKAPNI